ncbi:DNA primase [subsurface metagenome]
MGVIDEVKQKIDIVEVIGESVSLTKVGRTFRALCPFHSEKHPSFYVYTERQSWHCFGACNTGGDVFSFIMKKQGIDFGEALRLLAERIGITIPSRLEPEAGKDERERLYQVNVAAAQYFHNLLLNTPAAKKARDYLARRGLLPKTISDFQLGFSLNSRNALKQYLVERGYSQGELEQAGLIIRQDDGKTHDRFRNKLLFPIFDIRGRVTGFGARVLDDSLPKYINSPQTPVFDKSSSLYGINLAAATIRQQNMAVIVEGYMDVITAHQNGFNNVVASMGTSLTEKQVGALKKLTKNMVLALDADAAGAEATLRATGYENILNAEVKVIILPSGKDPDDVIREDTKTWQNLLEQAIPIVDYTFDMVTSGLDLTTAKDKSLVVDKLLPIIAEIKDIVRRAHYLQKLARLVKVSERNLEAALGGIRASQGRVKEPPSAAVTRRLPPLFSSPVEEGCLAWLLQYPELKTHCQGLLPEYFENSENREIFLAWQKTSDLPSLKKELDLAVHEHLDSLVTKSLPPTTQAEREDVFASYVLRLREKFLRSLAAKREEVLAVEAESGGSAAELAKLKEQGVEVSVQLGEIFAQRSRRR